MSVVVGFVSGCRICVTGVCVAQWGGHVMGVCVAVCRSRDVCYVAFRSVT